MAIEFNCPYCSAVIRVPDNAGGGKGKCPKCATRLTVPKVSAPKRAISPPAGKGAKFASPSVEESPFAGLAAPPVVSPPIVADSAFDFAEAAPKVVEEQDPASAFGFSEPPARQPAEAPGRTLRPAIRPKASVKLARAMARGLWVVPVVIALALVGVAGWYVWQQQQAEQLGGELVAEWADELDLPPGVVDKSWMKEPLEDVDAVLIDLEKSPVPLRSPMMQVQMRGAKRGILVTVNTGQVSRFFRVDVSGDKPLAKYLAKHAEGLEERRIKEIEKSATAFAVAYRKVVAKKADHSSLAAFRDSLALPALVRGLGHQVVATYGRTIYPCVYEDRNGALYFSLPPDAKEFEIHGRQQGETIVFPARYKVTVEGKLKASAKKDDAGQSTDTKSKKYKGPVFQPNNDPGDMKDSTDDAMKKGE